MSKPMTKEEIRKEILHSKQFHETLKKAVAINLQGIARLEKMLEEAPE